MLGDERFGGSQVALANLDAVLLESRGTFEMLPEHVLLQLEEMQRLQNPRASASPQADSKPSRPSWCLTSSMPHQCCSRRSYTCHGMRWLPCAKDCSAICKVTRMQNDL